MAAPPDSQGAKPAGVWDRRESVRLLVVDDEPDAEAPFCQRFRREVRHGFYTLESAQSAAGALDVLDSSADQTTILPPSEIKMPGMSGLDLLQVVKQRRPNLPVFMIPAYGDSSTINTATQRGPDNSLTKPVEFAQLKQAVLKVMPD